MGCNMVVALGPATVDGHTLFGHTLPLAERQAPVLCLLPARPHAPDEMVRTQHTQVPQVRQTHRVLCSRAAGMWGAYHGVNEHGVGAGSLPVRTRFGSGPPGLTGTDLVRLVLERGRTARQAVDALTDLMARHGLAEDSAFLIADDAEAFAVEAGGRWWAYQEVQEVRAQTDVCTVRQDWDRIAPGLAQHAISCGWWDDDGSKVDFAGVACADLSVQRDALLRWGRSTAHLCQQNGHIDVAFGRHLLAGRLDEGPDEEPPGARTSAASLVAGLAKDVGGLRPAWCSLGAPALGIAFPVFLEGPLPAAFTAEAGADALGWDLQRLGHHLGDRPDAWDAARDALARLQARFDQEAEEFAAERSALKRSGQTEELERQVGIFLEHCLERFREVWAGLLALPRSRGLALSK